jgi:hypothetical protein
MQSARSYYHGAPYDGEQLKVISAADSEELEKEYAKWVRDNIPEKPHKLVILKTNYREREAYNESARPLPVVEVSLTVVIFYRIEKEEEE